MSEVQIDGTFVFVAESVTDCGWLSNRFDKNPDREPMRSLIISGVIAVEGEAVRIATDSRISFDPRANLIKFISASRGGTKIGDDEVVDPAEFVGIPISLKVESQAARDGGYFLRMKDPAALVEGTPIPECLAHSIRHPDADPEPFVWLDEAEVARRYDKAIEWQREDDGGGPQDGPPHPAQTAPAAAAPPPAQAQRPNTPPPARGEERGNERGQEAATAPLDDAWKREHDAYRAAAGKVIKRFGWDANTDSEAQAAALAAFWEFFGPLPKITAGRSERGGFNVNPGNHTPDELNEATAILAHYAEHGNLDGLPESIFDQRTLDEPFPDEEPEAELPL
jgi:hypothetical protein